MVLTAVQDIPSWHQKDICLKIMTLLNLRVLTVDKFVISAARRCVCVCAIYASITLFHMYVLVECVCITVVCIIL